MKPAYESWEKSVHCRGRLPLVPRRAGLRSTSCAWRQSEAISIWSGYLGADPEDDRPVPACVPSHAACESCHPVDELPAESDGIRMPHEEHTTRRNLECVDCHATVSHNPGGGEPRVEMATCSMCHNGAAAPDECESLPRRPTWPTPTSIPPDYIETHGELAAGRLDDCLRCHHDKAAFCDDCHARPPASHFAGDWRYSHDRAAEADDASCAGLPRLRHLLRAVPPRDPSRGVDRAATGRSPPRASPRAWSVTRSRCATPVTPSGGCEP